MRRQESGSCYTPDSLVGRVEARHAEFQGLDPSSLILAIGPVTVLGVQEC